MKKSSNVVGEGSYGCVHKPAMQCETGQSHHFHQNSNPISKLMLTRHAETEIADYALVATADPYKHFYVGTPHMCKPKYNTYNLKSAEKCDIYTKSKQKTGKDPNLNDYTLLIIPDGGPDLIGYAESLAEIKQSMRIRSLSYFWKEAHRLFKGIMTFQKHNIVHDDVKPQNILYNSKLRRVNFIDFGFITKIDRLIESCYSDKHSIAEYFFWSYPCEFPFMNQTAFMKIAALSKHEKVQYFENLMNELESNSESKISVSMRVYFDTISPNYTNKDKLNLIERYLTDFKEMIINEINENNYPSFIQKSVNTVDVFGLALSLQYVLSETRPYGYFDAITDAKLRKCFYNMMTPSVKTRYTIQQAYSEFKHIMSQFRYKNKRNFKLPKFAVNNRRNHHTLMQKQESEKFLLTNRTRKLRNFL